MKAGAGRGGHEGWCDGIRMGCVREWREGEWKEGMKVRAKGTIVVDRCVCFDVRFAELKEVADARGAKSIAALQAFRSFGHRCQLCHPYVRRMLRTGEIVFRRILTEQDEPEELPGSASNPLDGES